MDIDEFLAHLVRLADQEGDLWRDNRTSAPHKQVMIRFPNGFGASVVGEIDTEAVLPQPGESIEEATRRVVAGFPLIRDQAEIGVLVFQGEECRLSYETEVTGDVLRHLSFREAVEAMERIGNLPPDPGAYARSVAREEGLQLEADVRGIEGPSSFGEAVAIRAEIDRGRDDVD